ncbi:hypothetical protein BSU04_44915 [Caballeronia sordidicola]|uniref:Uncharacterized protein n=1 Tax=Caballeronia sordidicola TaxID=196367 RepID=A0A226WMB0_CABSO|nr:hypothetical protein BSU04_44915 [Caballeronia sordidicola]
MRERAYFTPPPMPTRRFCRFWAGVGHPAGYWPDLKAVGRAYPGLT